VHNQDNRNFQLLEFSDPVWMLPEKVWMPMDIGEVESSLLVAVRLTMSNLELVLVELQLDGRHNALED
jgi:hypothetical protein